MLADRIIEWGIRIVAWGVQIGAVLLISAVLTAVVVWGGEELIRKKRGRFLPMSLS